MADLKLELLVRSLLSGVCLFNYIIEDVDFLLKIALDVVALRLCNVFHSVLLSLQLFHLFAVEGNLLLQLHDLILELVNSCLKAKGLLGAESLV